MCGIFGFIADRQSGFDNKKIRPLLNKLFLLSETRGKDAAGMALISEKTIKILKRAVRVKKLVRLPEYKNLMDEFEIEIASGEKKTFGFIGHARMVTNGSEETHENNQPVVKNNMVCLHNGIVVNDAELWKLFPEMEREYEVDTEIILSLVNLFRSKDYPIEQALQLALKSLLGTYAVSFLAQELNILALASNNGSLFFALSSNGHELAFASEKYILKQIFLDGILKPVFAKSPIHQIKNSNCCIFKLDTLKETCFSLLGEEVPNISLENYRISRNIHDLKPIEEIKKPPGQPVSHTDLQEIEKQFEGIHEAIKALKRCSRCLLPETFPFILFDEVGVCNYCHNYPSRKLRGVEELKNYIEPHRKTNGDPDCLVAVSGGRDSSYGLHYAKNVVGLNPVAYTYDWGMVTDLARRNIARLCGKLGVEHILVSADITTKRRNIQKNVTAWLKQPDLGTIPLFMAGDKPFFYFANMLKKQMNLDLVFFTQNPMERTEFKTAFCGIEEYTHKGIYYSLNTINQLRIAVYYAGQFLANPAYINSSLADTMFGFFSYYMIPKDFITLFNYIPWREEEIVPLLIGEYGWETAGDTRSTWRIGDGTPSFYNYIYYTMAGFSEYDTFRSNQLREGTITRSEALCLVEEENSPRYESIQWYCNTIGIDFIDTLKVINAAPKRFTYQK